jgi:biopolymer transport protein ExbB
MSWLPPLALFSQAWEIWNDGGFLMFPMAGLAILIYWTALDLFLRIDRKQFLSFDPKQLSEWVASPEKAPLKIKELLDFSHFQIQTLQELRDRFQEARAAYIPRIDRRIRFLAILVSISPLMGLLGTVMGMLATFDGLTQYAGRTLDLVAAGISEALITTQTGLMIAIPGMVLLYMVQKRRNHLQILLVHLETLSMQAWDRNHPHPGSLSAANSPSE